MQALTEFPETGDTVGVADSSGEPVVGADGNPVTVVVGAPPSADPGSDSGAGTTVTAEDGTEVVEVDTHPATESILNR